MKHVIEVSFDDLDTAEGISVDTRQLAKLFFDAVRDRLYLTVFESASNDEGSDPTFFGAPVNVTLKDEEGWLI